MEHANWNPEGAPGGPASEDSAPPRRSRVAMRLRNSFLTGLVIAAPLAITIYITWFSISAVDAWVKPLLPQQWLPEKYLPFAIPGVGLIAALIGITLLGALTANLVGRTIVGWGELMLDRMPLVRSLYRILKQIFETVLSQSGNSFQKVGLVEFPRDGMWSLVFIATDTRGEIPIRVAGGQEMMSVFLPCTPNPTTGFLLFMPKRQVEVLDMTVEEAAKLVISGGLVTPEYPKPSETIKPPKTRLLWPVQDFRRVIG